MNVSSIIGDIKKGKVSPVYILHGEESYFIDQISDYIEHNLLDEASRSFNQIVAYGKDTDAKSIIDEAKQYPMMSERRLVIVKEAQDLKNLQDLAPYVLRPVPHTVLVLCHKHKKLDKRQALGKASANIDVVFESKPFYDNQLPTFINEYARNIGLMMDHISTQMIADYLGNDLKKISNELDKLFINLGSGKKVTPDHVQEQIGISKEFNIFEYQNALGLKDATKIYSITNYFIENSKTAPIQVVVSTLYNYFSKVLITIQNHRSNDADLAKLLGLANAYFLKDYKSTAKLYSAQKVMNILVFLSEIDLKSKGVNSRSSNDGPLYRDLSHFVLKD